MKNEYEVRGAITVIFIKCKGKVLETIIDTEDLPLVMGFTGTWQAVVMPKTTYVNTYIYNKGKRRWVRLHRLIMNCWDSEMEIDHKNHNGLDNRKINLRICTTAQNQWNMMLSRGVSPYKGVTLLRKRKSPKKWRAVLRVNGAWKLIGYYETEKEAALAYNQAASFYYGEFALLNCV